MHFNIYMYVTASLFSNPKTNNLKIVKLLPIGYYDSNSEDNE